MLFSGAAGGTGIEVAECRRKVDRIDHDAGPMRQAQHVVLIVPVGSNLGRKLEVCPQRAVSVFILHAFDAPDDQITVCRNHRAVRERPAGFFVVRQRIAGQIDIVIGLLSYETFRIHVGQIVRNYI